MGQAVNFRTFRNWLCSRSYGINKKLDNSCRYGVIAEHCNNSSPPQYPPQSGQRILEARTTLRWIPRYARQAGFSITIPDIPRPYQRIHPQAYHCRSLRPLAFPGLRLFAAQRLFGILERILDTPATGKTADDLGWRQLQIGRKEKIVLFLAHRVAAYYQQYRTVRNLVPDDHLGIHQPPLGFAPFPSLYTAPRFYPRSYLSRCSQPLASFWLWPSSMFSFLRGQCVNGRIASHSADNVSMQQAAPSHSGIKAVRRGHKLSLGKPAFYLRKHLLGHFYKAGAIFAVQPHNCSCSAAQSLDTPCNPYYRRHNRDTPHRALPISGYVLDFRNQPESE